jgi:hypothetical protein
MLAGLVYAAYVICSLCCAMAHTHTLSMLPSLSSFFIRLNMDLVRVRSCVEWVGSEVQGEQVRGTPATDCSACRLQNSTRDQYDQGMRPMLPILALPARWLAYSRSCCINQFMTRSQRTTAGCASPGRPCHLPHPRATHHSWAVACERMSYHS